MAKKLLVGTYRFDASEKSMVQEILPQKDFLLLPT